MPTFTSRAIFNPGRNAAAVNKSINQPAEAQPCCCPACTGLQCLDRTRFFAGQLLSEADLNNEQSYWLAKNRLHNRYLHGWGVVCGMQVVCGECDGWVTIKTGYAIDPCGNDIIVCADQPFNVLKAIQACCTPPKPADCTPLRAAPPPTCEDVQQKWCITIQYEEQPARPVTPLRQASKKSGTCGCGCGSSKGGCGCGCGGSGSPAGGSSGTACCCSSAQTPAAASTTPGCEPTRILEGFRLGVCPAPPETTSEADAYAAPAPGTASYQAYTCIQTVRKLILQKPDLSNLSNAAAYAAACNYLTTIRKVLASRSFTNCQAINDLEQEQIPKPGNDGYVGILQGIIDQTVQLLTQIVLDCFCLALLPTCPPDPCINCLVLACVTVQSGKIIDICHFGGGRRQVVSFPSLFYWLGLFGFDKTLGVLIDYLEGVCCGRGQRDRLFLSGFAQADNLSTAGFSNPAMVNRLFSSVLSQNLGATIVNSAAPNARTLDLRPLVGLTPDEVMRTIKSNEITANVVDVGPAWTDTSTALGQQFAPAAFPANQPLTIFTSGKLVVGFEPTSPTDSLKLQIADLQKQVTALQGQIGTPGATGGDAPRRPRKG